MSAANLREFYIVWIVVTLEQESGMYILNEYRKGKD